VAWQEQVFGNPAGSDPVAIAATGRIDEFGRSGNRHAATTRPDAPSVNRIEPRQRPQVVNNRRHDDF
jgi:hypothetical protein